MGALRHQNFESKPFLSPIKETSLTIHSTQATGEALAEGHGSEKAPSPGNHA